MKKIIIMLLMASLSVGFVPAMNAQAGSKVTADFITGLLYKLGCIDSEMGQDEEISIGELKHTVNKVSGMSDDTADESTEKMALIQAVRILVDRLGYKIKCKSDNDYMVCANEIRLLKNVNANQNDIITKRTARTLIYNALTIPLYERTAFGNSETYEKSDKTFLKDIFGVRVVSGVLQELNHAVGSSGKDSVTILSKEYGAVRLSTDLLDVYNAIGMNVDVYVKLTNGNTGDVTSADFDGESVITFTPRDNDIMKIKKGDILSYDATAHKVTYDDGQGNEKTIQIDGDAVVVYNGKTTLTNTTMKGSVSGFTQFVDNNMDDSYDYAVIWDYYDLYVDAAYPNSKTFRSKYSLYGNLLSISSGKNFKIDSDKFYPVIEKDGKKLAISGIKKGDVLNIAVSDDKEFVRILVTSSKTEGSILAMELAYKSETELDLSQTYLTIADKKYKLSKDFYTGVKTSAGMLPYKLGNSGKFFLNFEGKIAYADIALTTDKYGYLLEASASTGIGTEVKVKILNAENAWNVYPLADKVSVNDVKISSDDLARSGYASLLDMTSGELQAVPQLILYNVTESGMVDSLRTAKAGYDTNAFSLDNTYTAKKYLSKGEQIGDAYITKDTLVFNIDDSMDPTDEDAYCVAGKDYFIDKNTYDAKIYDRDKDFYCGAVVVYGPKAVVNQQSKLAVVQSVTTSINEKGDQRTKLGFYEGKEEKSLLLSDDIQVQKLDIATGTNVSAEVSEIQKGVAFQYSMHNAEEIGAIVITADLNSLTDTFKVGDMEVSDKYMVVYGAANVRTDTIGVKTSVSDARYKADENTSVYQYDKTLKKLTVLDLSSVENDSKVLVKITNCKATEVIKIK